MCHSGTDKKWKERKKPISAEKTFSGEGMFVCFVLIICAVFKVIAFVSRIIFRSFRSTARFTLLTIMNYLSYKFKVIQQP